YTYLLPDVLRSASFGVLFALVVFARPPRSALFPYTTLFRSQALDRLAVGRAQLVEAGVAEAGVVDVRADRGGAAGSARTSTTPRSEEHTSELQSREKLVCRLLLEKKKSRTKEWRAVRLKRHN